MINILSITRRLTHWLLALPLLALSGTAAAQLGDNANVQTNPFGMAGQTEFLPVEEAYQLEVAIEGPQRLRLYWQIADGYYLYQHSLKATLATADGAVAGALELPAAQPMVDEFFGETAVYYYNADVRLQLERTVREGQITVTSQGCADAGLCYPPRTQQYQVNFDTGAVLEQAELKRGPAGTAGRGATAVQPAGTGVSPAARTLLYMLLLAFGGGVVLNLMPCVFPILSLKVLSFARSTDASAQRLQGWWYSLGVVLSFLLVAGLLLALRAGGSAIGWGFQLQSTGFVIALAYLFVAMGLSLSGLVHFGGSLMNLGSGLANASGHRGSFFTGVLAVLVASPCTAPFMGTALGFALTQPAWVALVVFASLGAGMAAPLLLLGYSASARRLMPRPGPWMERLKEALAFPLYASALWLFWVVGRQAGVDTMAAALFGALLLALGLWLWGDAAPRRAGALLALVLAIAVGSWRGEAPAAQALAADSVWSEQAVRQARADGRAVFVDFTADWCITCLANKRTVLDTAEVQEALAAENVRYLVADWTNHDPEIADFLTRMGRSGIPFYLLYPADAALPPVVLPQILRKGTVLAALAALNG